MIISINSIPSTEITRSLVVGFGKKFISYCSLKSLIPVEVLIAKQSEISEQLFKLTSTAYDPDVYSKCCISFSRNWSKVIITINPLKR